MTKRAKPRDHNIFDPDVRQCIRVIERQVKKHGYATVAEWCEGQVSGQTLRNWLNYAVTSPRSDKLFAATRACGGRITVGEE